MEGGGGSSGATGKDLPEFWNDNNAMGDAERNKLNSSRSQTWVLGVDYTETSVATNRYTNEWEREEKREVTAVLPTCAVAEAMHVSMGKGLLGRPLPTPECEQTTGCPPHRAFPTHWRAQFQPRNSAPCVAASTKSQAVYSCPSFSFPSAGGRCLR